METIYSLFKEVSEKYKTETAIIENDRILTFGELSDMVDMIADGFPQDTKSVGIVMSHRAEMIAAILAVLKIGAMYVPAEPDFPTGRIHYMMNEANVDFILTENLYTEKLNGFSVKLTDCEICGAGNGQKRAAVFAPDLPAYVLYTSGTTGKPKGVCVTNSNVCH